MKLYRTLKGIIVEEKGLFYLSKHLDWDVFINREDLHFQLQREIQKLEPDYDYKSYINQGLLPPIMSQEVWAAGVTYLRSKKARMEEAKEAGGGDFYDKVYEAQRPELFFKSAPKRVVGHKQAIRIRKDSKWNVPEPELTLFINSSGTIVGYTIGNDVSSRDIEGENPLYLPQAKCYDGSTALGPCLLVPDEPISLSAEIRLEIYRNEKLIFHDTTSLLQLKRNFKDLVCYLLKELTFPHGCFLMTGTGIVPPDDFSLLEDDEVKISIEYIGSLHNYVTVKKNGNKP